MIKIFYNSLQINKITNSKNRLYVLVSFELVLICGLSEPRVGFIMGSLSSSLRELTLGLVFG